MTDMRSRRFEPDLHDVDGFECGEESLDVWLREQASTATKRGTARTWVWLDGQDRVVGYYALAAHKVARERVPTRIGRGGPLEIPAVLLARLALARDLRGRGLGAVLVADALERVVAATQTVAARLVVVDALSEPVARFYEGLGFRRIPGSLHLVQKVSDVEAALRGETTAQGPPVVAHGGSAGVRHAVDRSGPVRWVAGSVLNELPDIGSEDAESLKADIAVVFAEEDYVANPWEGRE